MSTGTIRFRTKAIFVTLVTLLIVNLSALEALAVQAPRPSSSLFIQTSGPNAGLGIGDYYSSPAGGNTDHLFLIRVPSDWPAGTPVTVALYDPELGGPDPVSPTAADEVRGAADQSQFRLESPGGSPIATGTYNDLTTNGLWVELATFDPGVTGTGNYQLRVRVSDDDDNSWRVDASHDPDCTVAGGCLAGTVVNGNETATAPSGSGSLAVGVIRTSWQHAGAGTVCQDHHFFVNSATPRPLRAHNFDMDGAGSVTYTSPTGASIPGTVSGNAAWNNSSNANRVGDVLPDVNGWWRAAICVTSTNQYVFEAPSAGPSFPEPQPTPRLDVAKDDSVSTIEVGDQITYTVTVDNVSDEDSLPDAAYAVTATDTLPAGLEYVSCSSVAFTCSESSGVVTASLSAPLQPGTAVSFEIVANVTIDAGTSITNSVAVDFEDHLGNGFSESATDVDSVDFIPMLSMGVSGPVDVLRGDSASLTYTVEHGLSSDQSPVSSLSVTCAVCDSFTYASGDDNSNSILDYGEVWVYDAIIATGPGDPSVILAEALASGLDLNDDAVEASVTGQVNVIEPASWSGVVFEDLNGNGVLDAGEPGIEGATITLTGPTPGSGISLADGSYGFADLAPGEYEATVSGVAAPLVATSPGSIDADLAAGESYGGANFGFAEPVTISGTVFADDDEDGTLDGTEPGLAGVEVVLEAPDGTVLATTASDAGGLYSFETMPGEYVVVLGAGIPAGWALSTPASIETGLLLSGDALGGNDFGAYNNPPVMIEGSQTIEVGDGAGPLSASDPQGDPVTFTVIGGSLPDGLTLNPDGSFSGTAGVAGVFSFEVEVCDQAAPPACATFSYEIEVLAVEVTVTPDPGADGSEDPEVEVVSELPFTGAELSEMILTAVILIITGSGTVAGLHLLLEGEDEIL